MKIHPLVTQQFPGQYPSYLEVEAEIVAKILDCPQIEFYGKDLF